MSLFGNGVRADQKAKFHSPQKKDKNIYLKMKNQEIKTYACYSETEDKEELGRGTVEHFPFYSENSQLYTPFDFLKPSI